MDQIKEAHEIINEADRQIAGLFVKRMEAVRRVAEYKQEHGLPVYDANRERLVVERNASLIEDDDLKSFYVSFIQNTLEISKQYQRHLLGGMRVAYSGVEGAFANIAARKIFPEGRLAGYPGFAAAYRAVVSGECDCAVLPFENSYAGVVDQVMELMVSGDLYVSGVYRLLIMQNLLGVKGARVEDVKRVISHPQALAQCEGYISEHNFEAVSTINTAVAAMKVAELNDPSVAAIASRETAELYGLDILEKNINENLYNTTKFAVFTRAQNQRAEKQGKFILIFTLNDETGALAKAINVISDHGYNMRVLRSHKAKGKDWQYYFYIEADGDETSENGQEMLRKLGEHCENLRVAGHYRQDIEL